MISIFEMDTVDNECWKKSITETHVDYDLMHNLVFDFLVTEGYHDVAQTFKNEVKSSGLRTKLPEIDINEKTEVQKQVGGVFRNHIFIFYKRLKIILTNFQKYGIFRNLDFILN